MCAFVHDCVLDSGVTIENNSSGPALDIVNGCLDECCSNCERNSCGVDTLEKVCHLVSCSFVMGGSWELLGRYVYVVDTLAYFGGANALRRAGVCDLGVESLNPNLT